jgi:hypothetical protein
MGVLGMMICEVKGIWYWVIWDRDMGKPLKRFVDVFVFWLPTVETVGY